MKNDVRSFFSESAVLSLRKKIAHADGNEVFFAGEIDADGLVVSVADYAHGNRHAVPVHAAEARRCSVLIHNHPGGSLVPSDADVLAAADASERGQGFYIVDNAVSDVCVVVAPVKPRRICLLDEEEAGGYLADGGPLSMQSENFEERPVQVSLLKDVVRTFNQNGIGVFEAGTGVGKSFAYLIPSLLWALKNQERVVISTGTINLQQQLCEKDIPAAERIVGRNIKFVLMKGRQNYVCRRRFEEAASVRELFGEDTEILDRLSEWVGNSPTGSRSDIPFAPPESVWGRINSESDACMGMRCPHHADCFVMKVRKEAAGANIIVVNHHLLFADIESRMHSGSYDDAAVLPPYRRIVFDEAHGIESAATSFFSESF
ncbi:MAG: ATP-dependent DNA helicase, partial [Treponemataceae bacterium]|nr:ATP-dependent DNA helicase [Treponemataceae bacterium]